MKLRISRRALVASGIGWLVGGYLLTVGPPVPPDLDVLLGGVRPASAEEAEAASKVAEVAEAKLAETVGRDHTRILADGTTTMLPAVRVDGLPLTLSHLQPGPMERYDRVSEVVVDGHRTTLPYETDVWVGTWSREGVDAGWDAPADVKVSVVLEVGTDKVLSVNVAVFNPNAEPLPPPTGAGTMRCETIGESEARFCYRQYDQ